MTSAADKVFATAELLEMILIGIDMQTLLLSCQRVDKTFKSTIDGSRELQQALWFLPDPDFKTEVPGRPAWMDSSGIVHWETPSTPVDPRNPLLLKFGQNVGITSLRYHAQILDQEDESDREDESCSTAKRVDLVIKDFAADHASKRASWQKMAIFQGFEAEFSVKRADYKTPEGGPHQSADRVKSGRAKIQWKIRVQKSSSVDTPDMSKALRIGEIAKCLEKTIDMIIERAW